jgi:hypothetical protein
MLSECKGDFDDIEMPHKMDEHLHAAGLPTDIDVIRDLTGDSEAPPTPHPHTFPIKMLTLRLSSTA